MKLQVINEERKPESVAPKIKVFDTEVDLNAALPDLKDGAIVATKEDETSDIPGMPKRWTLRADMSKDRKLKVVVKTPFCPVIVCYYRDDKKGWPNDKPDPFVAFFGQTYVKAIPFNSAEYFQKTDTEYVFTMNIPKSDEYPNNMMTTTLTDPIGDVLISAEIIDA